MAPCRKGTDPSASPPLSNADGSQAHYSLTDVSFVQQLLRLAQEARDAERESFAQPVAASCLERGVEYSAGSGDGIVAPTVGNGEKAVGSGHSPPTPSATASGGDDITAASAVGASPPGSSRGRGGMTVVASIPSTLPEGLVGGGGAGGLQPRSTGNSPTDPTARMFVLLARALHADTHYWTNLKQQACVEELVHFFVYCAAQSFSPLKTQHLLVWLQAFNALVEGRRDADDTVPVSLLPTLRSSKPSDTADAAVTMSAADSAADGEKRPVDVPGVSPAKRVSADGAKGHRRSSATSRGSSAGTVDPAGVNSAAVVTAAAPSELRVSYDAALREALTAFLTTEVEEGWRWEQVPRQPLGTAGSAAPMGAAPSSAGAPGKKRPTRNERAKQQQQQQQELEEEQRRQAAAAALPPENIYLKPNEINGFVDQFIRRGALAHAALREYVAQHDTQPNAEADSTTDGPIQILLAVETPAPLPLLDSAVRFTNEAGVTTMGYTSAVTGAANSSNTVAGAAMNAVPSARPPSGAERSTDGSGRHSSDALQATTAQAVLPAPAPVEGLRQEQAKELAAQSRRHREALTAAEHRAKAKQTQQEMELTFGDREDTTKAVVDVYTSLEREVSQRQTRILQRITALEISLGLKPDPRLPFTEGDPAAAAAVAVASYASSKAGGAAKNTGGDKR